MNKHVGFPGERLTFTVMVENIEQQFTDFGPLGIHKMIIQETGDVLIWVASSHAKWLEQGGPYTIKATVKTHEISDDGSKRTIVSHVAEHNEPQRFPRVAIGLRRGERCVRNRGRGR